MQCHSIKSTVQTEFYTIYTPQASLVTQMVKNLPAIQETWVGKIPWRRERLPTPVFFPGEFHGLFSPGGHKELDITEQLSFLYT